MTTLTLILLCLFLTCVVVLAVDWLERRYQHREREHHRNTRAPW